MKKIPLSELCFYLLLFLFTGFLSVYLYYTSSDFGWFLNPGILYTSATVVMFSLTRTSYNIRKLLIYYLLMVLNYVVIFVLTLYSSWFAFICGHFTAAAGSLLSFMLVNKYIQPISYNKWGIAGVGALSFLLTLLLNVFFSFTTDKSPMEFVFTPKQNLVPMYAELFIFWQVLTGIRLFIVLERNKSLPAS